MSRRGRPKKSQPLYTVQDLIEYTSDSDSDYNNVQSNVQYNVSVDRNATTEPCPNANRETDDYRNHAQPNLYDQQNSSDETYNSPQNEDDGDQRQEREPEPMEQVCFYEIIIINKLVAKNAEKLFQYYLEKKGHKLGEFIVTFFVVIKLVAKNAVTSEQ